MNLYPWKLLPRLAAEIEHARRGGAGQDMETLLRITWRQSAGNLTLWKMRCSQIAGMCVRGALRGGAPSDVSFEEHMQLVRKLSLAKTRDKVHSMMCRYLDGLLDGVRPAQRTSMERAVEFVRKSMGETLVVSQSLSHYAHILEVSEGHLSRCFAAITGRTFRMERRRLRMEAACQMLRQSRLKISAIARQLGIADPSQFIAGFRLEFGVTPNEYRRKYQDVAYSTSMISKSDHPDRNLSDT